MATPQKKYHWSHFSLNYKGGLDKRKERREMGERKVWRQEGLGVGMGRGLCPLNLWVSGLSCSQRG